MSINNRKSGFLKTLLILLTGSLVSCLKYDLNTLKALSLAKENRGELETVLHHYSEIGDKQKLKAACYLIANMPYHQSFPIDNYRKYCHSLDSLFSIPLQEQEYYIEAQSILQRHRPTLQLQNDLETITSDFLIHNIELSFNAWETSSFLKHLSFDEFCEYILPYKCLEGQPLHNWKDNWNEYGPTLQSINQIDEYKYNARRAVESANNDISSACKMIVQGEDNMKIIDILFLSTLLKRPYGSCREMAQLVLLNNRSKALPVSLDYNPNWPDRQSAHYWNNLIPTYHKGFDFEGLEYPGKVRFIDSMYGKVFRLSYKPHPLLLKAFETDGQIPESLHLFSKDVTDEYEKSLNIKIRLNESLRKRYAYIAVFDNHNWIPVDIGKGRGKHVKFYNIPKGILYIVGTYEDGKFVPKSSPFILTQRGKIEYVKRSNTATDFRIYRKYPSFGHIHWVKDFLRMGRIEASQSPTFEHVDSIVGFADKNYFAGEVIIPDTTARQYWRLISSNAKSSDFAEIYFYERESGSRINGKLIFSVAPIRDSLYDNPRHICDNDPLTYVAVEDSDTSTTNFKRWVGFDFGKPVSISKVAYIRRGDGNDICPGDYYELYYWDNNKWILHEGKKAETIYLDFNHVPANALYYIKNCSRGQQNRTFILENNQIRWY